MNDGKRECEIESSAGYETSGIRQFPEIIHAPLSHLSRRGIWGPESLLQAALDTSTRRWNT